MNVDDNNVMCSICGISANLMCQRCGEPYCNDVCQRRDWQRHKYVCTTMPALVSVKPSKPTAFLKHNIAAVHNAMITKESDSFNESLSSMVEDITIVDSSESKLSLEWRNSMMPTTKEYFECQVTCMETNGSIWVIDVANIVNLDRLANNITRCMVNRKSCSIQDLSAGILVGVTVDGKIFRGEVMEVNASKKSAEVRLIDYGTIISSDVQNIYLPVQRMSEYKAFAFRVKLPNNFAVQIKKNLTLRLLGSKTVDGIEQAQLKPKSVVPLYLPFELLLTKPELSIVKILEPNVSLGEPEVALVQLKAMSNLNDDLNAMFNTKPGDQFPEPFSDDIRTMCLAARTKQGYRRAFLIDFIKDPMLFLVYEMDDGCLSLTSEVCRIPNALVGNTLRVFAITLDDEQAGTSLKDLFAQYGPDLSIKFNMDSLLGKDTGKLRVARAALFKNNNQVCAVRASTFLGLVNTLGHKYWREPIENDDFVYISHVVNYQEVYISSVHSKKYEDIFKSVEAKCTPVDQLNDVVIGSVMLVVSSSRVNYRAEITGIDKNKFVVRNIDTGSTHLVVGSNLRRPCRFVENLPVSLRRVKLKTICNIPSTAVPPNSVGMQILKRLHENKLEMQVKFDDSDDNTVDLLDFTAEPHSLMTRLLPVLFTPVAVELKPATDLPELTAVEPQPIKSPSQDNKVAELLPLPPSPPNSPCEDQKSPKQVQRYYFNDLERHLLPLGDDKEVIVLHAIGLDKLGYITACFFACEAEAEDFQNSLNLVAKLGSEDDKLQPGYLPEVGEICLTLFVDDNSWYRGVCKRVSGQNALIYYCDFGNVELVPRELIKPISPELLHGVYATKCFIDGFDENKPFVHLENYLSEKNKILCDVLEGPKPNTRMLKIPSLDKILSKELI